LQFTTSIKRNDSRFFVWTDAKRAFSGEQEHMLQAQRRRLQISVVVYVIFPEMGNEPHTLLPCPGVLSRTFVGLSSHPEKEKRERRHAGARHVRSTRILYQCHFPPSLVAPVLRRGKTEDGWLAGWLDGRTGRPWEYEREDGRGLLTSRFFWFGMDRAPSRDRAARWE
jgi:hypothetical protein